MKSTLKRGLIRAYTVLMIGAVVALSGAWMVADGSRGATCKRNIAGLACPKCPPRLTNPLFGFFPHAVNVWEDGWIYNFCDMDPSRGFIDYNGTNFGYDSHRGQDSVLRSFDEQTIGVPIFAAMDGVVITVHDGEFDRNTTQQPAPVNLVVIDHGGGLKTRYLHMKQWSIPVVVGQQVKAGQQIGLTGSSGNSDRPHLHFECLQDDQWFEPSAGPYRPGPSFWLNQLPIKYETTIWESILTDQIPAGWAPPFELPRKGAYVLGSRNVRNVTFFKNVPAGATWRRVVRDPNGTIRQNSGNVAFQNQQAHRHNYINAGGNPINLDIVGEWSVEFFLNQTLMVTMPFTVVATPGEVVNRPPNPIGAVMDPITGDVDLPVFVRVVGPLLNQDPDYDVVRYRYLWKVNGNVARDVVSAGRADCIPHGTLTPGDTVSCTVTPSDGVADGPSAMATVLATADSGQIINGYMSGNMLDVRFRDGRLATLRGGESTHSSFAVELIGRSHAGAIGGIAFSISAFTSISGAEQVLEMYDFSANAYVEVDSRVVGTAETLVTAPATGDPNRFVGPNGELKAKVSYTGNGNLGRWAAKVNQVAWELTQ